MLGAGTRNEDDMTAEQNKFLIQRLVEEAVNQGNLDVLAEVAGQVHFTVLPGSVDRNRHLIGRALA
jgi:hypothetical protein